MSENNEIMLNLVISPEISFNMRRDVLNEVEQFKNLLEDFDNIKSIPLYSNFDGYTNEQVICGYTKIFRYLNYHFDNPTEESIIHDVDKEKNDYDDQTKLCEFDDILFGEYDPEDEKERLVEVCQDILVTAIISNYINASKLQELCCYKIAKILRGRSTEAIRILLDIEDDLTEETKRRIEIEREFLNFA